MINNELFTCKNKDTYPPFKNGLYLEEFFFNRIMSSNFKTKRTFIPALWTNFQIEHWFQNSSICLIFALYFYLFFATVVM